MFGTNVAIFLSLAACLVMYSGAYTMATGSTFRLEITSLNTCFDSVFAEV